jgi:hypothetical protein
VKKLGTGKKKAAEKSGLCTPFSTPLSTSYLFGPSHASCGSSPIYSKQPLLVFERRLDWHGRIWKESVAGNGSERANLAIVSLWCSMTRWSSFVRLVYSDDADREVAIVED